MSIGSAGLCPAVPCPAWHHCVSLWQETFYKQFLVRLDTIAFHSDRKLFASSFLSGLALLRFTSTGNFSPAVSYPAWRHCVSPQQETFCKQFPVRIDAIAFHSDRKLFASSFLSGLALLRFTLLRFTPTGNFSPAVFHAPWYCCASQRQETSPSCEIVKKNIAYTFPHVSQAPKRGLLFLYWFPSFHWAWTEDGFCFLALSSIFLFFLQDLVQLTFSWQNLFPLFSSPSFLCEKSIHNFSSCGQVNVPENPYGVFCNFFISLIPSILIHSYSQISVYISGGHLSFSCELSIYVILIS